MAATKLTAEIQKAICDYLRVGNTRKAAAGAAGICEKTFYLWLAKGEEEGLLNSEEPKPFLQFLQSIKKAESECEAHKVAMIQKAGADHKTKTVRTKTKTYREVVLASDGKPLIGSDGNPVEKEVTETETVTLEGNQFHWQANAWWLERRRRPDYGNSIDIRRIDDETLLALLERDAAENAKKDDTENLPATP